MHTAVEKWSNGEKPISTKQKGYIFDHVLIRQHVKCVSDFTSPEVLFGRPPSKHVSLQGLCNLLDFSFKFKPHGNKCTSTYKAEKGLYLEIYDRNKHLTQTKQQKGFLP